MERIGLLVALFASALLTGFVVLLAAAAALTARGSVSLAALTPPLAAALNEETAAVRIGFEDAELGFDRLDGRLHIRLDRVKLSDGKGRRLASVPEVGVRLRAGALLERRLEIEQLTLLRPRVRLVRDAEGHIELGFDFDEEKAGEDLLATWVRGEWPGAVRTLSRIRVDDAYLVVDDRLYGIMNANLTENRGAPFGEADHAHFENETGEARIARRREVWTEATVNIG